MRQRAVAINLFVPNVQPGEPLALRPYQLRSADHTESLAVALNQVTFVSFDYPGHVPFLARALELVVPALEDLGVSELSRVVYRYENEVALTRDEHRELPVDRILQLRTPDGSIGPVQSINIEWNRCSPAGLIGAHIRTESSTPAGADLLKFSIHATAMPGGQRDVLGATVGGLHDTARGLFEAMIITDDFRKFLSAEEER